MFRKAPVVLLIIIVILSGCGTTHIVVTNYPSSEIFVNGVYKGRGSAEIRRTGVPKKSNIVARYQGVEIGSVSVRRKFDAVTFMAGYCTYGIGFILCWRYPETVFVPVEGSQPSNNTNLSPWDAPSGTWDKK
jgi:hypothetical protein